VDHAKQILGAIIPGRRDLLLYALQHLTEDHFRVEQQKILFIICQRYYDIAAAILPKAALTDSLSRKFDGDISKSILYEELYDEVEALSVADHEFYYSVDSLKDMRAWQLTGEAITTSMAILQEGQEINGVEVRGHLDARTFLYSELARVDKLGHTESAPEGDIKDESKEILQDYADRKSGKSSSGVRTGIQVIDLSTSGFQNGEMILVCAYTGQGKSMLVTQCAWNAAYMQGKNVFFATSETVRAQVRRRIVARHSRLPQFGLPEGLNSSDIKNGTLDENGERVLQAVTEDIKTNPAYGRLHIVQVPRDATLGFLEARLQRQAQSWLADLVIVDYLALLKPDRHRGTSREEYNDILKDAKTMAVGYNNGQGVPLLSPWAMSQTAFRDATKNGHYQLANLAETSEAEKSSDQILSMLRVVDVPGEVRMQFLKVRDDDLPEAFNLAVDYRCAFLGDPEIVSTYEGLIDGLT
jgi:archaellum biogenesis ATPase FlaH